MKTTNCQHSGRRHLPLVDRIGEDLGRVGRLEWGDEMLVNKDRLTALRDEIGAEGFDEVVSLFLQESAEVVERLGAQVPGGLSPEDLHFLKGSALTLGFDDLADLCRRSEIGPQAHPSAVRDLWEQSCAAYQAA